MQEEFEKKVQERMLTFGMQPSPQVWDDIDAALGKRKHRRVFIGWWILLGLVMAGGGILFYQKDNILHNELNQQPIPVVDSAAHNNLAQAPAVTPAQKPAEATEPVTLIKPAEPQQISQSKTNTTAQANSQHNTSSINATTPLTVNNALTTTGKPANSGTGNNTAATVTVIDKPQEGNTTNSGVTEQASPVTVPSAELTELPPTPQAAIVQDSSAIRQQPPSSPVRSQPPAPDKKTVAVTPKTIASTRHQWFFNFGGGTTQTTSFGKFNSIDNNGLSAPNTGGNADIVGLTAFSARQQYAITQPKSGFHLFAGLTYQYKLAKQWRLAGGLQATYASNTQQTGAYTTNSPFYISNNSYIAQTSSTDKNLQEGYYQAGKPGSEYSVVNKAWQLQVPVNVTYVVNPRAKTKLLVNAGLAAAWTLNSRWLIPDNRYNKLYYNTAVLNGTTISWQAGPAIELKNQWRFGLQYQQSFTTLAKTYVTPRLHWENISLYAGIPFTITLKKAKK